MHRLLIASATSLSLLPSALGAEGSCPIAPQRREREPAMLERLGGQATRHGDVLRLATAQGPKELADTDCEDGNADACQQFGLVDWIEDRGLFVLHVQYWEGDGYLLVDRATGAETRLEGYPWLSPDRARFVTATGDEADYNFNGIDVWRFGKYGPETEWHYDHDPQPDRPVHYCFREWREPDRIGLWAMRYVEQRATTADGRTVTVMNPVGTPTGLSRTERSWRLDP